MNTITRQEISESLETGEEILWQVFVTPVKITKKPNLIWNALLIEEKAGAF